MQIKELGGSENLQKTEKMNIFRKHMIDIYILIREILNEFIILY